MSGINFVGEFELKELNSPTKFIPLINKYFLS